MFVAYELKMTLGDMHAMPLEELGDWLAFFKLRAKQQKQARQQGRGD